MLQEPYRAETHGEALKQFSFTAAIERRNKTRRQEKMIKRNNDLRNCHKCDRLYVDHRFKWCKACRLDGIKEDQAKLHTKLIMELTNLDRRNSRRPGFNPYALPQYFEAAKDVHDARSFARAFTATRAMHGIAKRLGFSLQVERGEWIV